jgi:hypothetical protein
MTIRIALLAGAAALFATSALADDPMANTYANTVQAKDKTTGATNLLYYNQDSSFTAKGTTADGKSYSYSGSWSLRDGGKTLCLAPVAPQGGGTAPAPSCSPLAPHQVGDTWTITNDQHQTFDISIIAGR